MVPPGRRTIVVLGILVVSMTCASGLLLSVEPQPESFGPPGLQVIQGQPLPQPDLFPTLASQTGRWDKIAIHFSGSNYGSATSLQKQHESVGLGGLAYHMVIGNGSHSLDGQLEIGFRWNQQIPGISQGRDPSGSRVIDICLIGDANRKPLSPAQLKELVRVVHALQNRLGISSKQVVYYEDKSSGRGRLFPASWFQQQLLNYERP